MFLASLKVKNAFKENILKKIERKKKNITTNFDKKN
jgi:hypothetical protein